MVTLVRLLRLAILTRNHSIVSMPIPHRPFHIFHACIPSPLPPHLMYRATAAAERNVRKAQTACQIITQVKKVNISPALENGAERAIRWQGLPGAALGAIGFRDGLAVSFHTSADIHAKGKERSNIPECEPHE